MENVKPVMESPATTLLAPDTVSPPLLVVDPLELICTIGVPVVELQPC